MVQSSLFFQKISIKSTVLAQMSGLEQVNVSDESEPSWLEPELELKGFQLGSARDLFPFSSKSKIGQKRAEIFNFHFLFFFLIYVAKSYFLTS